MNNKYKLHIDKFITDNYTYLNSCCKNIVRRKKYDPDDLLHELVIYLYENEDKVNKWIKGNDLLAFSVSWITLQVRWSGTAFKKLYDNKDLEIPINLPLNEVFTDILYSEDPYVRELLQIYSEEQVDKLLKIKNHLPKLSKVNQILFTAYFIENLSYDKIKNQYTFFKENKGQKIYYKSKKSIYNLMIELKKELLLCTK